MSDEIEIEEHDVLDNPTIKRIFPDLSVIKKELNEYFEEASNTVLQTNLEKTNLETGVSESEHPCQNSIPNSHEITTPLDDSKTETIKRPSHLHQNIIILGSKPNKKVQRNNDYVKKEPKLVLEDMNHWLNKSKRFCKKCLILFPKPYFLSKHYNSTHSKRNDVTTCKMGFAGNLYKCNICEKCFSNSGNLGRHIRNLHGEVYRSFKTEQSGNNSLNDSTKTEKTPGHSCFHCQEIFPTQSSIIEHLYKVLQPEKKSKSDKSISETSTKEMAKEHDSSNQNDCDKNLKESNLSYKDNCNSQSEPDMERSIAELNLSSVGLPVCDTEEVEIPKCTSPRVTRKPSKIKESKIKKKRKILNQMKRHKIKKSEPNKNKFQSMGETITPINFAKKPTQLMFYKCFICSKFSRSFRIHARHIMNEHKIKEVHKVNKEAFDPQCKFCSSKLSGVFSYNVHLYKNHRNIYEADNYQQEQIDDNDDIHKNGENSNKKNKFALKHILFKCMECDLFFLSSNAAVGHSKHETLKNTQECRICHRLLVKEDLALHKIQHSFGQSLTVYTINVSTHRRILYKCSNCTVHYSEHKFMLHYDKCDSETPDSLYCRVCDILINRDDMEFHGLKHSDKKIQINDFLIIESDMINQGYMKNNTTEFTVEDIGIRNRKIETASNLVMHFCRTCKCFINPIPYKSNVHLEGKCGHMIRTVCQECGLLLTAKTHATHKQYHKNHKFCLFDYQFYDLKTKKRICPPVPEYPQCHNCGVHFLRNSAISEHLCQDQDYIICSVCSMKLTEHAYKLHMGFHNYSLENRTTSLNETALVSDEGCNKLDGEVNLTDTDASYKRDLIIFYTCKSCQLTVNTYDKVVQHCQDHYDCNKISLNVQKCQKCSYMFQIIEYESHNKLHSSGKYNKDSIKTIDFDPIYFRFDNVFWTKHVFAYVSDDQIETILNVSIYRYECRLRMQEIQSGSSGLMLYKCGKCQMIIEPHSLYAHVERSRNNSCVKLRKTLQCAFCSICFDSKTYRSKHEAEHESLDVNLKSYKIILFNKEEHDKFNNILYDACSSVRYIVYQCRSCERIVDKFHRSTHKCDQNNLKLCSNCGLLLHKQDFDSHFIRHEEIDTFKTENINVVMFGKRCQFGKKVRRSSFRGTIYDYTIYKCTKCDLCFCKKNCKTAHVCVFDNSKCKCSKCGFYFSEGEMIRHSKLHESNVGFDDFTINIINFELPSTSLDIEEKVVDDSNVLKPILEENKTNGEALQGASRHPEEPEIIYKCDCGLHFLVEDNAHKHAKNCNVRMKISRQMCIKCDLLFTPGELFNHLLKHHCDKKQQFMFDIVNVTKKKS